MKYQCPIYMAHTFSLVRKLRETAPSIAAELEEALREDQHELYHDGEFAEGCDICDAERAKYS